MSLRDIDLNLVPVLRILLREKSVSHTAELLGLSQPAVSAALGRIRRALGDDLLIRVGRGMELTQRAIDLIEPLDRACSGLEALVALPSFDPSTAERTFVIATPDQATFLLAPRWLDILARTAPGVRLRFVDLSDAIHEQIASRAVDFAMLPSFFLDDMRAAPLRFRPLYRDHSVALFRTGHPLAERAAVCEDDLAAWRMLSFQPGSDWVERKRESVLLGHRSLNAIAYLPQIALLPFLLLARDDYAVVSRAMAEQLVAVLPLAWRPLAFETPPVDIGIAWSRLKDTDPAHRWFREEVVGVLETAATGLGSNTWV